MEHLFAKYLNNELSQEEWRELRNWLDKSDLNRITLNHLKSISANINYEAEELEDVVWQELKLKRQTNTHGSGQRFVTTFKTYLKIAAILLIVSVLALIAYKFTFQNQQDTLIVNTIVKEAPLGRKITTRLPDGTMVTINSGSRITFPDQFNGNSRDVVLNGEAFFEVVHNLDKPFFVRMNGDQVRVLGTSFNIRSYPDDNAVYVSVATGRVSYSIPSGEEVVLTPNQMVTYHPSTGSLITGKVDRMQSFGWKDQIIYFKSITFDNMIIELERWYGVKIDVQGDFKPLGPFTGEFRNESLYQVLLGLSKIYHFKFKIDNKEVTLIKSQPKQ